MKTTLVIMAAGLGSRYGGNKQVDGVGPNNEILMEYSIYDAIRAGFSKVVFIIKPEMEGLMHRLCGDYLTKKVAKDGTPFEVAYAFQDFSSVPNFYKIPAERTKPFGTVHALLCAADVVHEPFCVINADDYYGKKAFVSIADFLRSSDTPNEYCMAGFRLGNTLSDNGTVTRGVCQQTDDGCLSGIEEIHDITRNPDGSASSPAGDLPADSLVSMNMWGFKDGFVSLLEEGFRKFLVRLLSRRIGDPMNVEFLIPVFVEDLLRQKKVRVRVLPSDDQWYGITYKEDIPSVRKAFADMTAKGLYRSDLYSDLQ